MLKFSLLILLSFSVLSAYSQTSSRKTKKIKKYVVNTQQRFQRDVNTLKEGYTSYGNQFFIKEYIVKGTVNFLSVTNGIALSSYQAGTSSSVKL
jgi:hypothetical protein